MTVPILVAALIFQTVVIALLAARLLGGGDA
ncbi:hypothetical protein FHU40_003732 [Nocardioides soli]|uniref:Uncharacterized protein n=1 Tax=Nocardioides soli TaxID=1036020 RepID=A0A7W4VY47_9ACTN|nr:hypothetical protein [Nocardioides soli]